MPADSTGFVVLGLTFGLPFTANPCLADQALHQQDGGFARVDVAEVVAQRVAGDFA